MTKYLTLSEVKGSTAEPGKVVNPTKTTKFLVGNATRDNLGYPYHHRAFDNMLFIGYDDIMGDVFKCWNDGSNSFAIFFGRKGDEFI